MSSKLMPPNVGAKRITVSTISSGSLTFKHTGKASTPANSLNKSAFPSITGIAANGPILPNPSTAVPSETIATVFFLIVRSWDLSGSSKIALHIRATPGVYAIDRSCRSLTEQRLSIPIFPPS